MRRFLVILLLWPMAAFSAEETYGDPYGVWQTPVVRGGGHLQVELGPCAYDPDRLCGVVRAALGGVDEGFAGRTVLADMVPAGRGRWRGGQLWVWERDQVQRAGLSIAGAELVVEHCVALMCRSERWRRLR